MVDFRKKQFDEILLKIMGYIPMCQYVVELIHILMIYLSNKTYF